ncbi:MAG: transketolase [Pseudomonadota bacterium]|nr:transketolase [Pseudomonadota bacterium]
MSLHLQLKQKSAWLRRELFEMFLRAKQGHPGSVFSQIEITAVLYYGGVLRYRHGDPEWSERDKVIVSKGHATMGLYPILADIAYFPKEELTKYGSGEGILRIFGNITIPGIEVTTGSLAHGQGVGAGFAYSNKKDGNASKTFVIISEGEMYEGSVWETALFASHHKLDNLILVIDRNRNIILGDTEDLVGLSPVEDKWRAFGWDTYTIDGHSIEELLDAFHQANNANGKPKVIVANTVKGKGSSIMENRPEWHYWQGMTDDEINFTRRELRETP